MHRSAWTEAAWTGAEISIYIFYFLQIKCFYQYQYRVIFLLLYLSRKWHFGLISNFHLDFHLSEEEIDNDHPKSLLKPT